MSLTRLSETLLESPSPPAVQLVNPTGEQAKPAGADPSPQDNAKVVKFAGTDQRMQAVVLRMALLGNSPKDIAKVTGYTEDAVLKIAESEWASKELEKMAAEETTPQESIRNLIRLAAFPAALRLKQLVNSPNHMVALGAIKVVLEHSILAIKEGDLKTKTAPDARDVKAEHALLDVKIAALVAQDKKLKVS